MSNKTLTLLASMLVTFVPGSVHAFSEFILSFEALVGLPPMLFAAEIAIVSAFCGGIFRLGKPA